MSTVTTRRVLVASYSAVGVPGISVAPTTAWAEPTRIDSGSTRNCVALTTPVSSSPWSSWSSSTASSV